MNGKVWPKRKARKGGYKGLEALRSGLQHSFMLEHKAASESSTRDERVGLVVCEEEIQSVVCLKKRVKTTKMIVVIAVLGYGSLSSLP